MRSTACPDWQRRILAGESLTPPPIYPAEAAAALDIFKSLRVVDAPGCPTMGEACKPWIFDFVSSVFGAYDADTGRREISEWLLSVSKKNFKSGLAAGIMLTALIRNWRESAEYGILAPTVEVANNSFFPARDMVRKDEELSDLFLVQDHIRTITHRTSGAMLKVIAAENETVGGKKFTGVLFDELWLFGKRVNAGDMMREATGGLASRPEGFVISLTTMSNEAPAGVFLQKLNYARGVRDGRIVDKKFVPVLYEFPKDMIDSKEYREPKNWWITNPNFGASVDSERLDDLHKQANEAGEEELIGFFAKHLNVEIGLTLRSNRWAGADFWESCGIESLTLDELLAQSEVVTVGIDGGGMDDLLGLAVLGRKINSDCWLLWTHALAHPIALERRKSEASKYRDFEKQGDLTIIEQLPGDVSQVAAIVARINDSGLLASVGMDPEKTHKIMFQALVDAGIEEEKCFGITQGWRMVGPISVAERKLAEGKLKHGSQDLMSWCVGNARVEIKGNATCITKQSSGVAKIDPLMAMFDAVSLMALNPEAQGLSVYEAMAKAKNRGNYATA